MIKILLASNSARRRQLIKLTGWDVTLTSADIDEGRKRDEPAREYVLRLAREKADAIKPPDQLSLILTADTIVVDHETIYGKPESVANAKDILWALRDHTHQVMTAIALVDLKDQTLATDLCISDVAMRAYSLAEVDEYIKSGDPMDKAGAYAIQNTWFHPVKEFSGCFASVMGMPLCHLSRTASRVGLTIDDGIPQRCQAELNYACAIYKSVLRGDIIG
jgi:nucleoside triphosphate pyrophosphatase